MKPTTRGVAIAGLVATVSLLAFGGWLFDRNIRRLADADQWVSHTHEVLGALDGVLVALSDAETSQRGFVITRDGAFLQPYGEAVAAMRHQIDKVRELTADNPDQQQRIPGLERHALARLSELDQIVDLAKRNADPQAAAEAVRTGRGQREMDEARQIVAAMRQQETDLLAQRADESTAGFATALTSNFLVISLAVVLGIGLFYLAQRYEVLQRQASRAIAQERELLRVTLASIGDAFISTDSRGRVTFLNAIAENITGWTTADARGRPLEEVFNIINETTRKTVESPCQRVLREGIVVGLANHTVLISRNGGEIPIEDSAAPIRDTDGNVFGVAMVFRDASEKRRSAEAKERLAAIVEDSHDAIIGEDLQGVITSWNRAAESLFGYLADEAIGKSIELIIPPERLDEFSGSVEQMRRGAHVAHIDTVRVRKDGKRVDVSSHISPIKNAEGEVIGASKISHDISLRKRSEEMLRFLAETDTALAVLVDYESTMQRVARLAVPFFADWCFVDMVDADGQIRRVAYAHRDLQQEGTLRQLVAEYPPDWNSGTLSVQVLRTGKPELIGDFSPQLIDQICREPRQRRLIEALAPRSCIVVPIVIRSRAVGTLVFVSSRMDRTYAATDLGLATELAKRAGIAVENAQLYRDLKEAQRQKDDFLAMLAHELRNPLAAIQYANEVAKMAQPDAGPAAEVIDRQVKTLAHLVDDLLDVSRITRDKIQLQWEPTDGATLIRRAVGTARPVIEERRHALTVEVSEEPMPLYVDPVRVEQILVNLLSNAAKYTPEQGQLTVRAYQHDGHAVFKIRDTGIGIPKEMLPQVFELFTQVDKSLDRAQGGLGIGLTVARKLTEMHGGSVSATSEGIGSGSEFVVRLPLSAAMPEHVPVPAPRGAHGQPLKILVVEDNVDTAESLITLLELAGHSTAVAYDGPAGLAAARSFQPDVILMDLGLPGLDGYCTAEALRQESAFKRVQMIAISGYGQAEDRRRSREAGFDAHLVKPVNFDDLAALLATFPSGG